MLNNHKGHSVFIRKGGKSGRPCLTNLVFLPKNVQNDDVINKLGIGDIKILSNVIYLNGLNPSISTFIEDVLLYVDKVEIIYSVDNVTWQTYDSTLHTMPANLYAINTENNTFTIGDGTAYYYSKINLYFNYGEEYLDICQFLMSSGNTDIEYNSVSENNWSGSQTPFGVFRTGLTFATGLKFTA